VGKEVHMNMSNSDWLQRWSGLDLQTEFHSIFVCGGWTKSKIYKIKVDKQAEAFARTLDAATHVWRCPRSTQDEQRAISAHEL
jgi:hypothetical protein